MTMPARIRAVFKGGVFRPVGTVNLPDNAEVDITVLDRTEFSSWWDAHTERMRLRTTGVSQSDIDADITAAIEETRSARRHDA
jgi:predicted DNA-binding antitoxin AbrB/MazE fold protein